MADEQGAWLRGDILGLLCADALQIEALAIPVSGNTAVASCGRFAKVALTKIGSPYVIAEFAELAKRYQRIAASRLMAVSCRVAILNWMANCWRRCCLF